MNKASERYSVKVEIPISAILETIFSDDNKDVETLCRWAKKYGFVDLIKKNENDKLGYYKLQDDYTKQSFYILLDKDERKQYDYENYLCEENEQLKSRIDKAIEYIKSKECQYGDEEQDNYDYDIGFDEVINLLEILKGDKNDS